GTQRPEPPTFLARTLAILSQSAGGENRGRGPSPAGGERCATRAVHTDRRTVLRRGPDALPGAFAGAVQRFADVAAAALSLGDRAGATGACGTAGIDRRGPQRRCSSASRRGSGSAGRQRGRAVIAGGAGAQRTFAVRARSCEESGDASERSAIGRRQ